MSASTHHIHFFYTVFTHQLNELTKKKKKHIEFNIAVNMFIIHVVVF